MSRFSPYLELKRTNVDYLKEAPAHWSEMQLCRAVSWNDEVVQEGLDDEEKIRYVDISSVSHMEGITQATEMKFADAPSRARRKAKEGDVVVSTVRTYLKAVARVTHDYRDCVFSTGFAVIRARPTAVHSDYLEWLMLNELLIQSIEAHSEGLSYPAINASALVKLKTVFPPINEQAQISSFLNRETTRIDTLIAKKTRFIELLKEKRLAVIAKAVTRGLDDSVEMKDSGLEWLPKVPAHWEVRRMASIFREAVRPGDPSLPILSISIHDGITDEELAAEDRDRRVTHIEDRSKYKRVKPNDIAYNMMRAWQGAFGAVAVEGLVSPAYVVAEPIEDLQTGYIEQLLRTPMAVEEMRRYSRGIADFRMRLYWEYFRDLKVCLPPVVEQKAILERIRRATTRIDVLVSKTERSIELLKEHRASLITAAVTGKIDVREAA